MENKNLMIIIRRKKLIKNYVKYQVKIFKILMIIGILMWKIIFQIQSTNIIEIIKVEKIREKIGQNQVK